MDETKLQKYRRIIAETNQRGDVSVAVLTVLKAKLEILEEKLNRQKDMLVHNNDVRNVTLITHGSVEVLKEIIQSLEGSAQT